MLGLQDAELCPDWALSGGDLRREPSGGGVAGRRQRGLEPQKRVWEEGVKEGDAYEGREVTRARSAGPCRL